MDGKVELLRKCLDALAADAEGQLDSSAQQGCVPPEQYIDELALGYDDIARAAPYMQQRGEIDTLACECVRELNDYLSTISGQVKAHPWTAEALRTAQEWEQVRKLARRCLSQL
jgi:hypothetical protein